MILLVKKCIANISLNSTSGYVVGAHAAWMNISYYFILLYRRQMDLRQFIQKTKQFCANENMQYKLSNNILRRFTWYMIKQLKELDDSNLTHLVC